MKSVESSKSRASGSTAGSSTSRSGRLPTSSATHSEFEASRRTASGSSRPDARPTSSSAARSENEALRKELEALKKKTESKKDAEALERERLRLQDKNLRKKKELKERIDVLFRAASRTQIAFLVDATGSMSSWIEGVKDQVADIVDDLASRTKASVHVAFVAYRDYCDSAPCELLNFTSDLAAFRSWLSRLPATGGGDTAEDIFTGLEKVGSLSWDRTTAKVLFHIADAPCHGQAFHHGVSDDFPGGDKFGRNVTSILTQLRDKLGIQVYCLSHINKSTHKMVREFKRQIGDGLNSSEPWILDVNMNNTTELRERVFTAATSSVSRSVGATLAMEGSDKSSGKSLPIDRRRFDDINWALVPTLQGKRIKHVLPDSMTELLTHIDTEDPLHEETSIDYKFKIYSKPFTEEGATRLPFYAYNPILKKKFIAKVFRRSGSENNTVSKYKQQGEIQAVAAFMSQQFNKAVGEAGLKNLPAVKYTMCTIFQAFTNEGQQRVFNMEPMIEGGEIVKWNSNFGYINHKQFVDVLHAFSHWTWYASKRKLLVVDVQGIWDQVREQYTLFDPAIHCVDHMRFQASTHTNLGTKGIEKFFLTHKCNNVCAQLKLPKHPMQFGGDSAASKRTVLF